MSRPTTPKPWSLAKRVAFRFVFALVALLYFPFPVDVFPYGDALDDVYLAFWRPVVAWTSTHLLGFSEPVAPPASPTGSGDTQFAYVQLFCVVAIAAIATAVWSWRDRERTSYAALDRWLRVYARFALATAMMSYGAYKVIPSQFPAPTLGRLLQPIGNASPMGVLWTFMGASAAYTIFAGSVELVGGVLLTIRRTALLGALVSASAMANVVALNFCYDVPVKLYSTQLLLTAVYVMAPSLGRLARVFVLGRTARPVEPVRLFAWEWPDRATRAIGAAFAVFVACSALYQSYSGYVGFGTGAPKSPLYGVWTVDEFVLDGEERPPLTSDAVRWRRLAFDREGSVAVQTMSDGIDVYRAALDPNAASLAMTSRDRPEDATKLTYARPEPGRLVLDGTVGEHSVHAALTLAAPSDIRLLNRGFHWVNDYPYNR